MSKNFHFLKSNWPELAKLGGEAENYVYSDPQSSITKLRSFSELIVAYLYRDLRLNINEISNFFERLKYTEFQNIIDPSIISKFHAIRIKGNKAVHHNNAVSEDALWLTEEAYLIACWFYKSSENINKDSCVEFIPPIDQGIKENEILQTKIELENTQFKIEILQKEINDLKIINEQSNIEQYTSHNQTVAKSMNMHDGKISKRIYIEDIFLDYQLTSDQTELVKSLKAFLEDQNQNVFLLKGYAGTGKTFITKGLTEYFTSIGRNFVLAAPTGKAAKVIQEKTLNEAFTIHKTIYSNKDLREYKESQEDRTYKFYFELRVNENSNDTVYIIDEASMISNIYNEMEFFRFGSGYLLNDLSKYINLDQNDHNKKIIFIGDNAQLPPIGMNFSPALDRNYLTERFGFKINEFELKEIVRQKSESGILSNALNLRQSMEKNIYNQLDINTINLDVTHVESSDFVNKYLEISKNKINKDTMVIAYTNASVKNYNQAIRKCFYGDINTININDKVILLTNSNNYEIQLSNGDFGVIKNILRDTEHKLIKLKRKNKETNENQVIEINLYFRDIEIIFKDENNKFYILKCKIIENLLFSEQPSLTSDEHKAIYLDFVMRNSHLKPSTDEFKIAIKSDPYFNALRIKFGYAITCHKAQGSEWKNVILDCSYTQKQLSEGYYRWLYTAITRASDKLYVMNEPHLSLGIGTPIYNPQLSSENSVNGSANDNTSNPRTNLPTSFLDAIYQKVSNLTATNNIKIQNIEHNSYHELYVLEYNDEVSRVRINYNGKNIITKVDPIETNLLSKFVKNILETLVHKIIYIEETNAQAEFQFSEAFLEEYFHFIQNKVNPHGIRINNTTHLNYMERYTFQHNTDVAIFDFYYNGKKQFTHFQSQNNSSISLVQKIQDILE